MNKKILLIIMFLLIILSIIFVIFCNKDKEENIVQEKAKNINVETENNIEEGKNENIMNTNIKVVINNIELEVDLEDNATTKEFINLLPQQFNMTELNGNEKYVYLDSTLPTNPYNPKHIETGDVMLFGNNCLVVFYKSFDTSYSYTKIGHIDGLPDLSSDNIIIELKKEELK